MKNNILIFAALVLTLSLLLTACRQTPAKPASTTAGSSPAATDPAAAEPAATDPAGQPEGTNAHGATANAAQPGTSAADAPAASTAPAASKTPQTTKPTTRPTTQAITDPAGETVLQLPDESHGVTVVSKTSPVQRGNSLNLVMMGKPGHSYAVTFRLDGKEAPITAASLKAGDTGFASWDIPIGRDAAAGVYEITIRDTTVTADYVVTHVEIR